MKFRSLMVATAMILGLGSTAQAANLVRTVDSFDFLVDYSGSMMMTEKTTGMSKMEITKDVLTRVNNAIPDLGYMSSIHTAAPRSIVVPYGDWDMSTMNRGIQKLSADLQIFGRQTPLGNNIASLAKHYSAMARPTAIVLVSDGLSNMGYSPVDEAELLMQTQPGTCFHVISLAETATGQANLERITGLNACSVIVNGVELYNSQEAVDEFVSAVLYDNIVADALVLRGVNFAFDSSAIDAKSEAILEEVAELFDMDPSEVVLEGWTDSVGSSAYNLVLSGRRADAVKNYLVEQGVPAADVISEGMGESFKYDNDTENGRFLNRRVEIILGE